MGRGGGKKEESREDLVDMMFSWSTQDICNGKLFKDEVQKIPKTFSSVDHYLNSYIPPLIEETRTELRGGLDDISQAPVCEILSLIDSHNDKELTYEIEVETQSLDSPESGKKQIYQPKNGDIFAFSKVRHVKRHELIGNNGSYDMALVVSGGGGYDEIPDVLIIKASNSIATFKRTKRNSLFAVFLMNIITTRRIWKALNMRKNVNVIQEVLCGGSPVDESCNFCPSRKVGSVLGKQILKGLNSSKLNPSQIDAVFSSVLVTQCHHKHSVKLIWGPPGTGKTKTVSTLLWTLLSMKCKTLTCAPTNVAVLEVTSRLLRLVKELHGHGICSLGDIVLFGNKERMAIIGDLHDVFLDDRADRLAECFAPLSGWKHQLVAMIEFLEDCVFQYHMYLENEKVKEEDHLAQNKEHGKKKKKGKEVLAQKVKENTKPKKGKKWDFAQDSNFKENGKEELDGRSKDVLTFHEFFTKRFAIIAEMLKNYIRILCTHLPTASLPKGNFINMITASTLLESFGTLLCTDNFTNKELEELFMHSEEVNYAINGSTVFMLCQTRKECLRILRDLRINFNIPQFLDKGLIRDFCVRSAYLIFCTTSSSFKLHSVEMEPIELLVIDEAAQLRECESIIPLQLRDIRHAILIGDERQLPAMVRSKVSEKASFGRSLFERLGSLEHKKHLLNVQYRMHPSISSFPNAKFYSNRIKDAPNVKRDNYKRTYLQGRMYGSYSFINVAYGKEISNEGHSKKNMVEVVVVLQMVKNLFKAFVATRQRLSIGIISPYKAQVVAIQEKLGKTYEMDSDFIVRVKSIDGFQGGEEDVIIISTVRSNSSGKVGFLHNPQRTNVALTRARHCLWILGDEPTLVSSGSIWNELVLDARKRGCFFNAEEDNDLAEAIINFSIEHGLLDDLLHMDSLPFRGANWKVLFNDEFKKSFVKINKIEMQKEVIELLRKLSSGWRPKKKNYEVVDGSSFQLLRQYKIQELHLFWSVDVMKHTKSIQVLKVWDFLPLKEIPKLVKRSNDIFATHTKDYINRCKIKCTEGNLEVPMSWETSAHVARTKKHVKTKPAYKLSNHLSSLSLSKEYVALPPQSLDDWLLK